MRATVAKHKAAKDESEQHVARLESEVRELRMELEKYLIRAEERARTIVQQEQTIDELRKRRGD